MRKNSKCAIYKLTPKETKQGVTFYEAVVVENVYNSSKKYDQWEMSFVKCVIFTDLPIEVANFDYDINKKPYAFENISNPERSIIRVLDFSVESVSAWQNGEKVMRDGKQIYNQKFYINECEFDKKDWKSDEAKTRELERKVAHFKSENMKLRNAVRNCNKKIDTLLNSISMKEETLTEIKNQLRELDGSKNIDYVEEKAFDVNNIKFEDM